MGTHGPFSSARISVIIIVFLMPAMIAAQGAENAALPNILMLTVDEQHPDLFGFTGHPMVQTPNLDALAASGVVFSHAYTAAPQCRPARATWYTGRYPLVHGAVQNGVPLHTDEVATALPALLQWYGYSTALIGKLHVHPFTGWFTDVFLNGSDGVVRDMLAANPNNNVYEKYIESMSPGFPTPHPWPDRYHATDEFAPGGEVIETPWKVGESWIPDHDHDLTWLSEQAINYLESRQGGARPWFLHLSLNKPHTEFVIPAPYADMYDEDNVPIPPSFRELPGISEGNLVRHEHELRRIRAHYYGAMTMIDDNFGRVLDALESYGLADNTIVVYVSDHGAMNGEHNRVTKGFMWDGSARAPVIIRASNVPAGSRIDRIFDHTSIMPTILELAGIPVPDNVQGRSLVPLIRGNEQGWDDVAYSVLFDKMIRRDDYKLVDPNVAWFPPEKGHDEWLLYDMAVDPWEMRNLYDDPAYATIREQLAEELDSWWNRGDPGPLSMRPLVRLGPMDEHVALGATVRFRVAAFGGRELVYQWQRNGADLSDGGHFSGVNTNTLRIVDVDPSVEARYRCRVTSLDPRGGSSVSESARLVINIGVVDTFTLGRPGRNEGDPLVGTKTEVGGRTWTGSTSAVFRSGGSITNSPWSQPKASIPIDPAEAHGAAITVEADLNLQQTDSWVSIGFMSGTAGVFGDGAIWMLIRRDGRYSVFADGTNIRIRTGDRVEIADETAAKRVTLTYDPIAKQVDSWINGQRVVSSFDLTDLYEPRISHIAFTSFSRTGQNFPAGSIFVDNLRVLFGPYSPPPVTPPSAVFWDSFNRSDDSDLDGDRLESDPGATWAASNAQVIGDRVRPGFGESTMRADVPISAGSATTVTLEVDAEIKAIARSLSLGFPNLARCRFGSCGWTLWLEVDDDGAWRILKRLAGRNFQLADGTLAPWIVNGQHHFELRYDVGPRQLTFLFDGSQVLSNLNVGLAVNLGRAGFQCHREGGNLGTWQADFDNFEVTVE